MLWLLVIDFIFFQKPVLHLFYQPYNIIRNFLRLCLYDRIKQRFFLCCLLCCLARGFFLGRLSGCFFFRSLACRFLGRFSGRLFFRSPTCRFCFRCLSFHFAALRFLTLSGCLPLLADSLIVFLFLLLYCFSIRFLLCFPLLKNLLDSHLAGDPKFFFLFFHGFFFYINAACYRHPICQGFF